MSSIIAVMTWRREFTRGIRLIDEYAKTAAVAVVKLEQQRAHASLFTLLLDEYLKVLIDYSNS